MEDWGKCPSAAAAAGGALLSTTTGLTDSPARFLPTGREAQIMAARARFTRKQPTVLWVKSRLTTAGCEGQKLYLFHRLPFFWRVTGGPLSHPPFPSLGAS